MLSLREGGVYVGDYDEEGVMGNKDKGGD